MRANQQGWTHELHNAVRVAVISLVGVCSCVVGAENGSVFAWGWNDHGQVGDGSVTNRLVPVQLGISGVVSVSCGYSHSLALLSDGTVLSWGENLLGELGDGGVIGSLPERHTPAPVAGLTGVVVGIAASDYNHSVAVKSDGTVWSWGKNFSGQLGDGTSTDTSVPVKAAGVAGAVRVSVSISGNTFAILSNGQVWGWGRDFGATPARVSFLDGASAVVGGDGHFLALMPTGTVLGWGVNANGELGDGTTTDPPAPITIPGLTGIIGIGAGDHHSVVLRNDGTVWAWGWNAYGQLGDGTTTTRLSPVQVVGLSGIRFITCFLYNSYAIDANGAVWAWGPNSEGEHGNGTTTDSLVPVKASLTAPAGLIASGGGQVLARITNPNTAPVANAQDVTTIENTQVGITLTGSDANNDTITYTITTQPLHGNITDLNAATGTLTYTPEVWFIGTDSFAFVVSDPMVASSPATVTITVASSDGAEDTIIRQDELSLRLDNAAFKKVIGGLERASFGAIDLSFEGELAIARSVLQPSTGKQYARWSASGTASAVLASATPIPIPNLSLSLPKPVGKYIAAGAFILPTARLSLSADRLFYDPRGDRGGTLTLQAAGTLEFGAQATLKTSTDPDALLSFEASGSATVGLQAQGNLEFTTKEPIITTTVGIPPVTIQVQATASIAGLGILSAQRQWTVWRGQEKTTTVRIAKIITAQ